MAHPKFTGRVDLRQSVARVTIWVSRSTDANWSHVDEARPLPLRQFIVKLHSRCNLACDYCYVYTKADQRWRTRPVTMSEETLGHTARAIGQHVRAHALKHIEVVLHGGEPVLAGTARIRFLVERVRAEVGSCIEVRFSLQTNGTLLTESTLNALLELDVQVGVSVDGSARDHDRHRRSLNGGSHRAVSDALHLLGQQRFRPIFAGLLCTVDLVSDPVLTYEALLTFEPPSVDFLLPLGNWTHTPPQVEAGSMRTPYADWLMAVFDRWYGAAPREMSVRLFEEMINVLLGGQSAVEGIGLTPSLMAVVETDGAIEQCDQLASTYEGAAMTGLHVARNSFDDALRLPAFVAAQLGAAGLPSACRPCELRAVCGGGLRAHRYREGEGFDNPSVYCADLFRLISHVRTRLTNDLSSLNLAGRAR